MSDLGEQLRDYIDDIATPITVTEITEPAGLVVHDLRETDVGRRRRGWLVIAGALVAAAVIAGSFIGLRQNDSVGRVETDPATNPSQATPGSVAAPGQGSAPVPTPTLCEALDRLLDSPDGSGGSPRFPDAVAGARAAEPSAPPEAASDLKVVLDYAESQIEGNAQPSSEFLAAMSGLRTWRLDNC